jgi:hypothetical protein
MNETEAGVLVEALWSAVSRGGKSLEQIPGMIKRLLETEAWKKRTIRTGKIVEHTSFYSFLTTPPLDGCGYDPVKICKLISDDPETLVLWREAMKGKEGGDKKGKTTDDNIISDRSPVGTSRSYTLTRLKHYKPKLFQEVVDGKLSANAAAIAAGFRKKRSPLQNLRAAWAKTTADERRQFLSEVTCP